MKVLDLLSMYYGAPIEFISRRFTMQNDYQESYHANGTLPLFGARSNYFVGARWYWWYYLENRGLSYSGISDLEGYNHATVKYALENKYLVEDQNSNKIIYETESIIL